MVLQGGSERGKQLGITELYDKPKTLKNVHDMPTIKIIQPDLSRFYIKSSSC